MENFPPVLRCSFNFIFFRVSPTVNYMALSMFFQWPAPHCCCPCVHSAQSYMDVLSGSSLVELTTPGLTFCQQTGSISSTHLVTSLLNSVEYSLLLQELNHFDMQLVSSGCQETVGNGPHVLGGNGNHIVAC